MAGVMWKARFTFPTASLAATHISDDSSMTLCIYHGFAVRHTSLLP